VGLGKTLTTLALIDTLLTSAALASAAKEGGVRPMRTALVVAPATVLDNWLDEVDKWAGRLECFRVSAEDSLKVRLSTLERWQQSGGLCIIGFEAFLALTTRAPSKARASPLLVDPGADLIILDEGHRIKNVASKQHAALSAVATPLRLILTGTPMQNNLLE
jgi:transcriptional regulator ATRX